MKGNACSGNPTSETHLSDFDNLDGICWRLCCSLETGYAGSVVSYILKERSNGLCQVCLLEPSCGAFQIPVLAIEEMFLSQKSDSEYGEMHVSM
jgi:hypothetical protein